MHPPLVRSALNLAARLGFEHSCSAEVGQLLAVLTGSVRHGRVGEIGAGCGVGSAWIASALRPGARLVTVEQDSQRAKAVEELLSAEQKATVLHGDWTEILRKGPFDLLFLDAKAAKEAPAETFLPCLLRGGMVLLDDLTPRDQLPAAQADPLREKWLGHPAYRAAELRLSASMSVILATKV